MNFRGGGAAENSSLKVFWPGLLNVILSEINNLIPLKAKSFHDDIQKLCPAQTSSHSCVVLTKSSMSDYNEVISSVQNDIQDIQKAPRRKFGFTLAEVLITLGVIGIVAAMTLPSLIGRWREKTTVAKVKKIYSMLNEAVVQMTLKEGFVNDWGDVNQRAATFTRLAPQNFQIIKHCPYNGDNKCDKISYKNRFNDIHMPINGSGYDVYYLKNGMKFSLRMSGNCIQDTSMNKKLENKPYYGSYATQCGEIYVDVNSDAPPNTYDIDTFKFYLGVNGIVPAGSARENIWTETFENQCLGKNIYVTGNASCTAWVIFNENMDYLHCSDLSWKGKSKCN